MNLPDFFGTEKIPEHVPQEQTHKGTTLLVDADIIAFQSAATTDGRQYVIEDKMFKYKKDADRWLLAQADKGRDVSHLVPKIRYNPEPESYAIRNVNASLSGLKQKFPGSKMECYLTGPTNFRNQLDPEYKANRRSVRKPEHLNACKQYIINNYGGIIKKGMEADDLLGIRQCEIGGSSIICTIDKDLDCIPGAHYNWRKDKVYDLTEPEADLNFYRQCLTGDKTDNILGLKGIGPKKAEKILSDCSSPRGLYETVRSAWVSHFFPGFELNSKEMNRQECKKRLQEITLDLHRSASCLWILREEGIMWTPPAREIPSVEPKSVPTES